MGFCQIYEFGRDFLERRDIELRNRDNVLYNGRETGLLKEFIEPDVPGKKIDRGDWVNCDHGRDCR